MFVLYLLNLGLKRKVKEPGKPPKRTLDIANRSVPGFVTEK
jgi:hypothetical protein